MPFSVLDIVLMVAYGFVVIFGTVGNGLVIKWFGMREKRKKSGNKLVVFLAANDFLASIFMPLLQIHSIAANALDPQRSWYLGRGLCHSLLGIILSLLYATSMLLIAISVERFR